MTGLNPTLLALANWRLQTAAAEKSAAVPASAMLGGGGPPVGVDPAAAGGAPMPPGGDPAAAAAGAMPAPAPAPSGSPELQQILQMLQTMQPAGGGAPGAPGAPGASPKKVDPAEISRQLYNANVMLSTLLNHMGIEIPAGSLLGPPPGQPMPADAGIQMGGQPGGAAGAPADASGIAPIAPIQPMGGGAAGAPPADGTTKTSGALPVRLGTAVLAAPGSVVTKAAAIAALSRAANR